jgi:hypothetical protein
MEARVVKTKLGIGWVHVEATAAGKPVVSGELMFSIATDEAARGYDASVLRL